jgi:predicted DNA-binding transcriptional regulator
MILTEKVFELGRSDRNGFNNAQMLVFGLTKADLKVKGWKRTIIGKDFPEETINKFIELRNNHIKDRFQEKINL